MVAGRDDADAGAVGKRLRALVKLIDKQQRKPIYTDFEDLMGAKENHFAGLLRAGDFERFRAKARQSLKAKDHITIYKVRMNKPLTATDLEELERMLQKAGSVSRRAAKSQR